VAGYVAGGIAADYTFFSAVQRFAFPFSGGASEHVANAPVSVAAHDSGLDGVDFVSQFVDYA